MYPSNDSLKYRKFFEAEVAIVFLLVQCLELNNVNSATTMCYSATGQKNMKTSLIKVNKWFLADYLYYFRCEIFAKTGQGIKNGDY